MYIHILRVLRRSLTVSSSVMTEDSVDDDPLQLKDLAVKYSYLMYKITDHISNLSELTYESVTRKEKLIDQEYFDKQLHLNEQLQEANDMIKECDQIEAAYMKLDQLYLFVEDFKARITHLENVFKEL